MGESKAATLHELDLEYLNKTIDKFDAQRFSIRNWSVTATGALLAVAVSQKNAMIPIVAVLLVVFFAYLEVLYTGMQVRVQNRCAEVCVLLVQATREERDLIESDFGFGIRRALGTNSIRWADIPRLIRPRPELYLFYLGLVVVALASILLIRFLR